MWVYEFHNWNQVRYVAYRILLGGGTEQLMVWVKSLKKKSCSFGCVHIRADKFRWDLRISSD